MVISDPHRLILICNPKTASTSMRACFTSLGIPVPPVANHNKPAFVAQQKFPDKWQSYLTAGFCRNPFDRMVSIFHDFKNLRALVAVKFSKWLQSLRVEDIGTFAILKPQHWYLGDGGRDDKVAVKLLYRYENLQEDWVDLSSKIGISLPKLDVIRSSGHEPYQELYTKDTADMVRKLYQKDFELFGYSDEIKT